MERSQLKEPKKKKKGFVSVEPEFLANKVLEFSPKEITL